jgi:alpha-tubulin suppressor-like RCC1 family protein
MNNVSSFGVMNSSVLLLKTTGELLGFGDNNVYQLGDGTNVSPLKIPYQRTIIAPGVLANMTIEKFFISNSQTLSFFVKGNIVYF